MTEGYNTRETIYMGEIYSGGILTRQISSYAAQTGSLPLIGRLNNGPSGTSVRSLPDTQLRVQYTNAAGTLITDIISGKLLPKAGTSDYTLVTNKNTYTVSIRPYGEGRTPIEGGGYDFGYIGGKGAGGFYAYGVGQATFFNNIKPPVPLYSLEQGGCICDLLFTPTNISPDSPQPFKIAGFNLVTRMFGLDFSNSTNRLTTFKTDGNTPIPHISTSSFGAPYDGYFWGKTLLPFPDDSGGIGYIAPGRVASLYHLSTASTPILIKRYNSRGQVMDDLHTQPVGTSVESETSAPLGAKLGNSNAPGNCAIYWVERNTSSTQKFISYIVYKNGVKTVEKTSVAGGTIAGTSNISGLQVEELSNGSNTIIWTQDGATKACQVDSDGNISSIQSYPDIASIPANLRGNDVSTTRNVITLSNDDKVELDSNGYRTATTSIYDRTVINGLNLQAAVAKLSAQVTTNTPQQTSAATTRVTTTKTSTTTLPGTTKASSSALVTASGTSSVLGSVLGTAAATAAAIATAYTTAQTGMTPPGGTQNSYTTGLGGTSMPGVTGPDPHNPLNQGLSQSDPQPIATAVGTAVGIAGVVLGGVVLMRKKPGFFKKFLNKALGRGSYSASVAPITAPQDIAIHGDKTSADDIRSVNSEEVEESSSLPGQIADPDHTSGTLSQANAKKLSPANKEKEAMEM